ncbi:MAG: DMT family transporter [Phycisphaerales bacterium]|nr:DMT family transporter [Phycisphaerales bacterium]
MNVRRETIQADFLLLLASMIWGVAFVAQQDAAKSLDTVSIMAIRFLMGAAILAPLIIVRRMRGTNISAPGALLWSGGICAGLAMLLASYLQQKGMESTTASSAGFITGLYVLFVPLIGLLFGQRVGWSAWLGVTLAAVGLYLLSVSAELHMSRGDLLVLGCAVIWAVHVLIIGRYAPRCDPMELAAVQFLVTSLIAFIFMICNGLPEWSHVSSAWMSLVYLGALASAVAFTLQVVGQRRAPPIHAAMLLSMESPFAAIAGAVLISERLSSREYFGCALMLAGILVSQLLGGNASKNSDINNAKSNA